MPEEVEDLVAHAVSVMQGDYVFADNNDGPLIANGRCAWDRLPPSLVHPAFKAALLTMASNTSELCAWHWVMYLELEQVSLSRKSTSCRLSTAQVTTARRVL